MILNKKSIFMIKILLICLALSPIIWFLFYYNSEYYYLFIKSFHIIAIICWMAGLLYLPRLFVYHCKIKKKTQESMTFHLMEKRLLRLIMNPAMIVSWITGIWLAWNLYQFQGGWLHIKLSFVLLLSAFHGFLAVSMRRFYEGRNEISQRAWRFLNEIPTIFMVIIVFLVIFKIP